MTGSRRVLVLGGSGFLGAHTVRALLAAGCDVTSLSRRGETPAAGTRALRADRRDPAALAAALEGARFDATVDFCAYDSGDVERLLLVPHAALGRYTLISSGQVYLVTDAPRPNAKSGADGVPPFREEDSDRALLPEPAAGSPDHAPWAYGVGKRRAESAVLALRQSHGMRAVVLRLPVIHGVSDPTLRLWTYLERMLDGGPLLLPEGGTQPTRYLWVEDVARAVLELLERAAPREAIYNLAQPDVVSLREFLVRVAAATGRPEPRFVEVSIAELEREGLDGVSPLSGRWTSVLDPSRAAAEWGFTGTRLDQWLPAVVRGQLDHRPARGHAADARRAREIEFAARRTAPSPA